MSDRGKRTTTNTQFLGEPCMMLILLQPSENLIDSFLTWLVDHQFIITLVVLSLLALLLVLVAIRLFRQSSPRVTPAKTHPRTPDLTQQPGAGVRQLSLAAGRCKRTNYPAGTTSFHHWAPGGQHIGAGRSIRRPAPRQDTPGCHLERPDHRRP